jgi:hypothetical protein
MFADLLRISGQTLEVAAEQDFAKVAKFLGIWPQRQHL